MFLDVLRRRNPASSKPRSRCIRQGKIPANTYVLDLDAVEANARVLKAEADRLGLKVFAMTKQMAANGSFCRAVMRGGIDRRWRSTWPAPAPRTAPAEIGHLGHLAAGTARTRPRRPPRRSGRTTGPCSTTRRPAKRPPRRTRRGLCAGPAGPHPGRGRHLLSRPRGRLRRRRYRRGRRPLDGSMAAASPASPPSRRCSSIPRRARFCRRPISRR